MPLARVTNNKLALNRCNICSARLNHAVGSSRLQLPIAMSEVNYVKCFRSDASGRRSTSNWRFGNRDTVQGGQSGDCLLVPTAQQLCADSTAALCRQHSSFVQTAQQLCADSTAAMCRQHSSFVLSCTCLSGTCHD